MRVVNGGGKYLIPALWDMNAQLSSRNPSWSNSTLYALYLSSGVMGLRELSADGESGSLGRDFLASQLINAGQMLGDLWYSAWEQAPPDTYLRTQLLKRRASANRPAPPSSLRILQPSIKN